VTLLKQVYRLDALSASRTRAWRVRRGLNTWCASCAR
jgi:hypothetical protein